MAAFGVYLMGCALLVVAGIAKAARPGDTARALAGAFGGPPHRLWSHGVRGFAAAEAVVGIVAIVAPGLVVAVVVGASFAAFTAFVLYARGTGGVLSTCGCFGSPDTPPTVLHAVLDAGLSVAALLVAIQWPGGSVVHVLGRQYLDGVPLVVASALGAWLAFLVMSPLARLQALRRMQPYIPGRPAPDGQSLGVTP
jgi:hypothetical protein